jgi:hydroxymethylbilane synthase
MTEITIGSRGSKLALTQTNWVADRIKLYNPGVQIRIEIIRTKGDKILDTPLAKIGDKGLFVKEIETALAEGRIDLAVHSMKDLPSEMTAGLAIGAVPPRVDPSDVLMSYKGGLISLPRGSKVGSSSLRRRAQLMHHRPDLIFEDLRGNLDTRIRRLQTGDYDAIVLAYAGLHRLKWDHDLGDSHPSMEKIPFDVSLPAVGQGALAVQIHADDTKMAEMIGKLDDYLTRAAVTAERALLSALGGGCQTPIAALAVPKGDNLVLEAIVASLDGTKIIRVKEIDRLTNAKELGERTANVLLDKGADEILAAIRDQVGPTDMGAA